MLPSSSCLFFWGGAFLCSAGLEIFEIVAISFLPRRTRWQNFWPTGTHSMQEARLNRISIYRRSIFAYRTAHVARVIHDMSRAFCQNRKKKCASMAHLVFCCSLGSSRLAAYKRPTSSVNIYTEIKLLRLSRWPESCRPESCWRVFYALCFHITSAPVPIKKE